MESILTKDSKTKNKKQVVETTKRCFAIFAITKKAQHDGEKITKL